MRAPSSAQRSILITGASTGIGYHAAHAMAARGWQVIATARKDADLEMLTREGLCAVELDYADETSIEACLAATLAHTGGRLDGLFNNGAYGQTGALEDVSTEVLRAQFEANFFGWHTLTRGVLPIMRAQGGGRIVQCSSVLGFVTQAFRGPYQASKFALEGYSDTLRQEVEGYGIKVISIQPGPIRSRFRKNALATFERTIDTANSAYEEAYQPHLARMRSDAKDRFELGPEAVTRALIAALEHRNPRLVYRVTVPTHAAAFLKRVLPTRGLHAFLSARGQPKP
ncbi:MAG: SDR family NAD(P)-dependent oxidoreductase [Devosiaceae bacterium]|nr:SDR family NAD(P)-dependent oxidoreductase [Devosiaceae bacterium MH13]